MYLKRQALVELTLAEVYNLGQCYFAGPKNFIEADTLFGKVAAMSPNYAPAYLWRARSNYKLDSANERWAAQPFYEKIVETVKPEERATPANKSMMLEACRYLCDYYAKSTAKDLDKTKSFYEIILQIDPNDATAKTALGIK
jgi:tetratricopeptide (TPR) repeat protein